MRRKCGTGSWPGIELTAPQLSTSSLLLLLLRVGCLLCCCMCSSTSSAAVAAFACCSLREPQLERKGARSQDALLETFNRLLEINKRCSILMRAVNSSSWYSLDRLPRNNPHDAHSVRYRAQGSSEQTKATSTWANACGADETQYLHDGT